MAGNESVEQESRMALAVKCEGIEWAPPAECRRPLPCDLQAFDPGPAFNRDVVYGRYGKERKWAENNVDPASRHFQNGIEVGVLLLHVGVNEWHGWASAEPLNRESADFTFGSQVLHIV